MYKTPVNHGMFNYQPSTGELSSRISGCHQAVLQTHRPKGRWRQPPMLQGDGPTFPRHVRHHQILGVESGPRSSRIKSVFESFWSEPWTSNNSLKILLMATRNPANSPVELGSLSKYFTRFCTSKRWLFGISSINSTSLFSKDFFKHCIFVG